MFLNSFVHSGLGEAWLISLMTVANDIDNILLELGMITANECYTFNVISIDIEDRWIERFGDI